MKPVKALAVTMVLCLTLVVLAQVPEQDPTQQIPQDDADRLEAVHEPLFLREDAAAEASRLTEEVAARLPDTGISFAPIPRKNFVDEHIFGRIERDNIPHSPLSTDEEFLRRVYLDLTGLLPTPDQARAFLADSNPDKRDQLIDSLVGTEAFADQWAYHYGELLRTREQSFHFWTKEWLKVDRPFNDVFYDLLVPVTKHSEGFPTANTFYDPIGYSATRCVLWTDPDDYKGLNRLDWIDEITTDVGRVFLGLNLECISCHDGAGHTDSFNLFLTAQKRTDFWQQAAFYGKLRNIGTSRGAARSNSGGNPMLDDLGAGYNTGDDGNFYTPAESRFPRDGRTYEPAFLLTGEIPEPGENPRKALARMISNHIQFSRATVNLIWAKLMVVGLVEPYDGFDLFRLDPANPPPAPWTIQPSNPELLEALAEDFRSNDFSMHRLIKTIMKSSAYQLSTAFDGEWEQAYIPYHARRFARVLTGPEAVDIVAQSTSMPFDFQQYGQTPEYVKELSNPLGLVGSRGGSAGKSEENTLIFAFMQAYYQQERATPPVDKNIATPVQAMMMMTSPVVTKRLSPEGGTRVASLLESGKSDDEMIEELFLATLTRRPTTEEVVVAKRLLEPDRSVGAGDLQWVLLNSAEFLVNH